MRTFIGLGIQRMLKNPVRIVVLGTLGLLSFAASGCTDLAMQNYDHALKKRQITPTEYQQARADLDRRAEEYYQSNEARQK